jgi:glycosyltransferase involved in cell wall biosynthesis
MARWTDVIITMNEEDYLAARKFYLKKGGKVYKVHGVGITLDDYHNIEVDRRKKREELSLGEEDIVCICAGDLVSRKNYSAAIRAIARLSDKHIHFLICGNGPERDKLVKIIRENKIDNQIHLLGFRTDIKELLKISDIFLFTSLQEGLPRSLMEAMAVGLPVIASSIRGNVDLISDGIGGFLYEPNDIEGIACGIKRLSLDKNLREKMSAENIETIKQYDISVVKKEIKKIYSEWL